MTTTNYGMFEASLFREVLRTVESLRRSAGPFGIAVRADLFERLREDTEEASSTAMHGEFVLGRVHGLELASMPLQVAPAIAFHPGNEDLWRRYVGGELPEPCLLNCYGKWFRSSRLARSGPPFSG